MPGRIPHRVNCLDDAAERVGLMGKRAEDRRSDSSQRRRESEVSVEIHTQGDHVNQVVDQETKTTACPARNRCPDDDVGLTAVPREEDEEGPEPGFESRSMMCACECSQRTGEHCADACREGTRALARVARARCGRQAQWRGLRLEATHPIVPEARGFRTGQ